MAMHITTTRKSTEQIVKHFDNLRTSTLATRDQAISAIKGYTQFMADLHQEIKDADQFAYSRREGSAVQGKAVDRSIALEDCRQAILAARKALMEHFNICGSCFGQGQEGGWTCPVCAGSTKITDHAQYVCAWCRNIFTTNVGFEKAQTYCVNCQKHAPSAKAAGLSEMEWRKIAVHDVGRSVPGGNGFTTNYVPRFCKQYECSACGGKGHFLTFSLPNGKATEVQCGYCYPAERPAAVNCTMCGAPFTPTEHEKLLCVDCRLAVQEEAMNTGISPTVPSRATKGGGYQINDRVVRNFPWLVGQDEVWTVAHFGTDGRAYLHSDFDANRDHLEWPSHLQLASLNDFQRQDEKIAALKAQLQAEPSTTATERPTKKHNRFARGTGRYTCADCGKATRDTGNGEANLDLPLCLDCYTQAGLENEHQDGYHLDTPHPDCLLCQRLGQTTEKEGEEVSTDEGRVDPPSQAISIFTEEDGMSVHGTPGVLMGFEGQVPDPTEDNPNRTTAGVIFGGWLGLIPRIDCYDVHNAQTGEFITTRNTSSDAIHFIYEAYFEGLVSTVYAEPEAPATVPAQPQLPDRANQFIARLEAVEAKLDRVLGLLDPIAVLFAAERTALEAQVLAHGEAIGENTGAIMGLRDLLAGLIPAVQAANVTIGPKPTDAQATALAAVEAAVEEAQADPTEPCTAFGCKNGMIALGQKCPACKGTGRVQKRAVCWCCQAELTCARCFEKIYQPVPLQCPQCKASTICAECYTYQGQSCTECTKIFAPDAVHRTICPECRAKEAAQQAEPSTEPEALPMVADVTKLQLMPGTAENFLGWLEDDSELGRSYVEWAVWVLGNRQTADELAVGYTIEENGVGFNGADSDFGTSLFNWLQQSRNQQPHLTANQITAAARMLKKYVSTQLLPALQHSCPHTASPFKKGDWVEVTTWADQAKGPFQIEAHDWLNLHFVGSGMARWYDCVAVEAPQQAVEAPEDGLEDLEL